MLWKKESPSLYIDLFASGIDHSVLLTDLLVQKTGQYPHPEKSNTIALQKRNEGNEKFRSHEWLDAMESYNDSLRFAKPGSDQISLAYANRAACFLNLKMYENCLNDIELAIKAGYPKHLMQKLQDRKAKCLQEMQENQVSQPESVFEPDNDIPYMANVVKVKKNEMGNLSLVAKTDIDVGQSIIIDDVFCAYPLDRFGAICNVCAKEYSNLVPCSKCAVAMFCSECQGHFLHEHECGLNFCGIDTFNNTVMHVVRTVLVALKMFPTVDELMAFVEQIREAPNNFPIKILDEHSKYQAYFNNATAWSMETLKISLRPAYKTILRINSVNEAFNSIKKRRFLMHLIGHHMTIPFSDDHIQLRKFFGDFRNPELSVSPFMQGYFVQSCNPNVLKIIRDGKSMWLCARPIKQGDQLFRSNAPYEIMSTQKRQDYLWTRYHMKCFCSRCKGETLSTTQRQQLTSDATYRYIQKNVKNFPSQLFSAKMIKPLMDNCVEFLQKYGQMDWCDEIGYVLVLYQYIYFIQSAGGTNFEHPLVRAILPKYTLND